MADDLARLEGKIEQFILSQLTTNKQIASNLESLSETQGLIKAQQVQIDNLSKKSLVIERHIEALSLRTSELEKSNAVSTKVMADNEAIKKSVFVSALSIIAALVIWLLKSQG